MARRDEFPALEKHPRIFAMLTIAIAVLLAHGGSLAVPFFFDDIEAVSNNPTIRSLARMGDVLSPPADGTGVTGRPIVNLTLAVDYAFGGLNPRGYHATNLLLHTMAAWLLLGVTRRTLLLPALRVRFGSAASGIALAVALVWSVHPIQTESVACVIQRTELLAGVFLLLVLYAFVRAVEEPRNRRWPVLAVAASALGMASKEIMVAAPVLVLLHDRAFAGGSFRAAWTARRALHLSLAATWLLLLAMLVAMGGTRGSAAGLGLGVPWWAYALKQCEAIPAYLGLAFWPHPLVLDYGTDVVTDPMSVLAPGLLLLALVLATLAALRWRPKLGFVAVFFFAILAPSSSVVPLVTQTMAEHRMYLPLAAVVVFWVLAAHRAVGGRATLCLAAALALGFAGVSAARTRVMQDELAIWADTIAKRPGNARAHASYALALSQRGRAAEARPVFQRALELDPASAATELNLGTVLFELRDFSSAATHFRRALALKPGFANAQANLGSALFELGDLAGALAAQEAALALEPRHLGARKNAGRVCFALGRHAEAARHYAEVVAQVPSDPEAHYNLGLALARSAELPRALAHFATALRLRPEPGAYVAYARFLAEAGEIAEARAALAAALKLRPDFPEARLELERLPAR
ncbi:MAG: tetratricopeptide repeat protein [Opitutaceae bacterium]|nr:tetratricopeptide repeat protein [Opitutaceae bacterium]